VKLNKGDMCATRARARLPGRGRGETSGRCGRTWCVAGREHPFAVDNSLMVNITVGCQWSLNRDSYREALNRDRYYLRRINRDVQVHPPAPAARLYKAPSSSPSSCQFTNQVLMFRRPLSSPSVCCFLLHLHRLAPRTRYRWEQSLRNLALLLRSCSG
jgi:hypothetical protein